ncbi:glycoside hydrolase family 2 TIM barrel-domain containing protein [Pedobacter nutrimenti]|uniref:glycoside hydrolase family 2 TIM barrel-domain containing protein n=1 Tax=Pedobacter nutrimenti TaxID=1241337 RepID=UPI00292CDA78|nr:glycoside hydrolase family 2 TIM barrel-domain containing protein [Pedobacter nutrimenti]
MNYFNLKKPVPKFLLLLLLLSSFFSPAGAAGLKRNGINDTLKGAAVPREIEDPECLGINKEKAHATLMPYGDLKEALTGNRYASTWSKSLNGPWKFNWVSWPQQRPEDFYKPSYDVSGWKDIPVPSNWQVEGYGTPYYSNYTYIFKKDFPKVMSTPPVRYTAYNERNPVGSYRRDFIVPDDWKGRRVFITFDGVDAGFFIWVNGVKVGYSVNSRNAAEFDITKYVKPGKNMVAVEVYRFTTGSYLEDQDMWRLSGIFRNVTLWSSPDEHIRDYFIKADLDKNFKNAQVSVAAKIKNYGSTAIKARQLVATLYNGTAAVGGSEGMGVIPALQPGEEVTVHVNFPVSNPVKWTAETPKLYTTVVNIKGNGEVLETISSRTGFRNIEIKGRLFTINGVAVKLKGVNRHEHWPEVGHAITKEQMIRDIELIKQANCNHVRTCHYSDDPLWYELCDQYGLYVLAEANLECHGAWDQFNEEPRMKAAIIDRNVANVESFKNHPSVIIWSLGNECGSGGSNFRAALQTVRSIDSSRPVHYEGFGIGNDNPADIDSRMYTDIYELENNAKDQSLTKPFYLCEYAHAMFNSMGAVDEYNDLFDKYPSLLGGCIWEWQDQGLWNRRDPSHPIIAYGGGFGEVPNDKYFIHKGVIFSDRSPKPNFVQLKHAYQWITIKGVDLEKGIISIKNRYQFIDLSGFQGNWKLYENGNIISSGLLGSIRLKPGEEANVKLPYHVGRPKAGAEYFLRVAFATTTDELWAKKGFEIADKQLQLPVKSPVLAADPSELQPVNYVDAEKTITIGGNNFKIEFDKEIGTFSKLEKDHVNILQKDGGPRLHLWRAPHRIDDMWADEIWEKNGLKEIKWKTDDVKSKQLSPGKIEIKVVLTGTSKTKFLIHQETVYTISGNGSIKAINSVSFSDPSVVLARMGVRMFLDESFDQLKYFGRGPMENYADRKSAFDIGYYSSTVKEQLTPYEKPMECGNHEDIRWAELRTKNNTMLTIKRDTGLLQVSALPYSDEEMQNVEYRIDLPKSKGTVLCISDKTLGVGSWGCGPKPLEQYIVYAKPTVFTYLIQLSSIEGKR